MSNELNKACKLINLLEESSREEQGKRINDLYAFLKLSNQIYEYFCKLKEKNFLSKIAMILLENSYFFHDETLQKIRKRY